MNHTELFDLLKLRVEDLDASQLRRLGQHRPILQWFISDSQRQILAEERPEDGWGQPIELAAAVGLACAPVVWHLRFALPMADDAAILPLRWRTRETEDWRLPESLRKLAKIVKAEFLSTPVLVERIREGHLNTTHLTWADNQWSNCDFSTLALAAESAFAPLAIGLFSAIDGTEVQGDFLATGEFDRESHQWSVGHLLAKIRCALRLGFTRFAVPSADVAKLSFIFEAEPPVEPKNGFRKAPLQNDSNLAVALLEARTISGMQPNADDNQEIRVAWYNAIDSNTTAFEFYQSHLLDDVVKKCQHQFKDTVLENFQAHDLVTILSNSDELLSLIARLFQPTTMHIIYTVGSMEKSWERVRETLASEFNVVPYAVPDDASCLPHLKKIVRQMPRRSGINGDRQCSGLLIDTSPGRRAMSMAMMEGAVQGDRLACLWNSPQRHSRRPHPLDVYPLIWEVTSQQTIVSLADKQHRAADDYCNH